ncbi:hypothetical protein [Neoaquamicrobium sediminum]
MSGTDSSDADQVPTSGVIKFISFVIAAVSAGGLLYASILIAHNFVADQYRTSDTLVYLECDSDGPIATAELRRWESKGGEPLEVVLSQFYRGEIECGDALGFEQYKVPSKGWRELLYLFLTSPWTMVPIGYVAFLVYRFSLRGFGGNVSEEQR